LLHGRDLKGARVLDIGTGVGRWARWYLQQGATEVVGIDLEPMRLAQATQYGGPATYLEMPADSLAFPDSSFDVVNSITVLQHVDHDVKRRAIKEMARVLKPGGSAVIFEISDLGDDASHVYPWSQKTWTDQFKSVGLEIERSVGDQYTPILRMLKTAYGLLRREEARDGIEVMKHGSSEGRRSHLLLPLHAAIWLSYPIEEVARLLPPRFGRITGFLLRKGV
jgi:SAM-dependent methyltransferase